MKKLSIFLILAIILTLIPLKQALAQGGTCIDFSDFPTFWTIQHGNVVSGGTLWADDGTYNGNPSKYASATYDLTGKIMAGLTYQLAYEGIGDGQIASAWIGLYDANSNLIDSDVKYIGFPNSVNTGTWTTYSTKNFGQLASTMVVIIRHDKTDVNPNNQLGIHFMNMCYDPAQPINPTPTATFTGLPSPMPTLTPTTPAPSVTPSITLTPSMTLVPSTTPTGTLPTSPPDTPNAGVLSTYRAPTIGPPTGCDDDPNNPCGAAPFGPAVFPVLNLSSLTPLATTTGQPTLDPSISPTYSGLMASAVAFGTTVGDQVNGVAMAGTITINDPYGTPINLPGAINQLGTSTGNLWGAVRQTAGFTLGRTGQIIIFFLLVVIVMTTIQIVMNIIRNLKMFYAWITALLSKIPIIGKLL